MEVVEWRPVPGIPYEASCVGGMRRAGGHQLSQQLSPNGYYYLAVRSGSVRRRRSVHRMVCAAFHGAPHDGCEVRHLNGVRSDNRAENLAWGTRKENAADRLLHGTDWTGDKHKNRRLSADQVADLRRRHANGEFTYSSMARDLGVDVQTVRKAIIGESWKSIGEQRGECYK